MSQQESEDRISSDMDAMQLAAPGESASPRASEQDGKQDGEQDGERQEVQPNVYTKGPKRTEQTSKADNRLHQTVNGPANGAAAAPLHRAASLAANFPSPGTAASCTFSASPATPLSNDGAMATAGGGLPAVPQSQDDSFMDLLLDELETAPGGSGFIPAAGPLGSMVGNTVGGNVMQSHAVVFIPTTSQGSQLHQGHQAPQSPLPSQASSVTVSAAATVRVAAGRTSGATAAKNSYHQMGPPVSDTTRIALLERLRPSGPPTTLMDEGFNTPLHTAIIQRQPKIYVDSLLNDLRLQKKLVAIINALNIAGRTPLSLCLKLRRTDLIPSLLNYDAAPTQLCGLAVERTNHFHYAMARCLDTAESLDLVVTLVESVARRSEVDFMGFCMRDRNGMTPLDFLDHRISSLQNGHQTQDQGSLLDRLLQLRARIQELLARILPHLA